MRTLFLTFALIASPALAQDAAHDALAAKLVAVLPPASTAEVRPDPFAAERAATLTKAYPDKKVAIATAFADRVTCSRTKRDAGVSRVMLAVATALTDDELRGMIAFYTGPDFATADTIAAGSPEEEALLKRYPLTRFGEVMQAEAGARMFDEVMAAEDACQKVLDAALAREGITE